MKSQTKILIVYFILNGCLGAWLSLQEGFNASGPIFALVNLWIAYAILQKRKDGFDSAWMGISTHLAQGIITIAANNAMIPAFKTQEITIINYSFIFFQFVMLYVLYVYGKKHKLKPASNLLVVITIAAAIFSLSDQITTIVAFHRAWIGI